MMSARRISNSTLLLVFMFTPFLAHADHAININTADKETLMTLRGIGEVKAKSIIDYRQTNGPLAKIEDIQEVFGVGPKTFENLKDHIFVPLASIKQHAPQPEPIRAIEEKPQPPTVREHSKEITASTAEATAITQQETPQVSETEKHTWFSVWSVGFIALTGIGAAGTFIATRAHRKEWEIIEENS